MSDSDLFWWAHASATRLVALLEEIGRRYPGVPYWEIARDEARRAAATTEMQMEEVRKWKKSFIP